MTIRPALFFVFALAFLKMGGAGARAEAAALLPESHVIWDNPSEDGVKNYRIPQVLVCRSGLVIALAEARYKPADGSQADIVIRRSRDGGRTWTKSQFVEKGGPTDNHVLPVICQDRDTGRIFFFCALRASGGTRAEATQSYYRFSDDEGATWSEPVDVSSMLAAADRKLEEEIQAGSAPAAFGGDAADLFGRKHFYFGPGHPIQLSAHHPQYPGRLVIPVFLIKDQTAKPRARRGYGDGVLLSDDHGRTWRPGGPVPLGSFNSSEVSVVELGDGRLLLNARGAPERTGGAFPILAPRTLSWSSDGGNSWTRPIEDNSGLPHYAETHSGLLRIPAGDGEPEGGPSSILFCFPAGPKRTHGTVWLSEDNHQSWRSKKLLVEGTYGYSNLDRLPDGTVVLIYEDASGLAIHLVRFTLDWLRGP